MPGIGIVTNPNSRRNRRNPERIERLGYILGQDRDHDHALTQSIADIRAVAESFKAQDVEILGLNGGDGTNHATLSTFVDVYGDTPLPKIAFLRGGTMNTIANSIGVRGKPGEILLRIAEKYHLGLPFETTRRHLLRIDNEEQCYYGFIFGLGMAYNFLEAYYQSDEPSPMVALSTLLRSVASSLIRGPFAKKLCQPWTGRVLVDGEQWPKTRFSAVLAATIYQVGLGFRPMTRCLSRPNAFHVLGLASGPIRTSLELPKFRLGMAPNPKHAPSAVPQTAVFESDAPFGFFIDGDMHRVERRVTLTAGPLLDIIVA